MDLYDGEAYRRYHAHCLAVGDESWVFDSKGIHSWLKHLLAIKKITEYTWKRNRFLCSDLSAWFHDKVRGWEGKNFILFGYRGDSRGVTREMERIYDILPSRVAKTDKESLAVGWRRVAEKWMDDPRGQRAPVDGFRGHDAATLDRLAFERTLMVGAGKKSMCKTTEEWRERTGRSRASFDQELTLNRLCLWAEGKEKVAHNMYCRDCTSATGTRPKKVASTSKDDPVTTAPTPPAEEDVVDLEVLVSRSKRRAKPTFTTRRRPTGEKWKNHWEVSRHGVAMKILADGDLILLDPALRLAHLVSRCDLESSCRAVLSCLMEFWSIYEFHVKVRGF